MIYLVTADKELFTTDIYKIISVEESLALLNPLKIVGLDTETEGLDPWTKKLKLLQLGNRNFQVIIDCFTVDVLKYKDYLESDRTFLGWNLKFDLKFLFRNGIYPKSLYDGYLAEKLLWLGYPAGMHSLSLKAAGNNYLNIELDKSVRSKITYSDLTTDVIQYSADDVKYLEDIIHKQWKKLYEKNLTNAIKVENQFVIPLAYCEYCGIKLDINKWRAKMKVDQDIFNKTVGNLNNWVIEHFPKDSTLVGRNLQGDLWDGFDAEPKCKINWSSPKQVIPLFEKLGLNLMTKDRATGDMKKSVDTKVIKPQQEVSSIVPIYMEYKAAAKVVGTYGQNFIDQINPISGRIHTNFTQLGADTTRITSGGKDKSNNTEYVNLLNLPANATTRDCFVAEPGNKWISLDYKGQETYLMASIANDKAILKELTEGSGDIHSLVAYMSYPEIPRDTPIKDIKKLYPELRQNSKGTEFGINYGGDANTIYINNGIPLEEAHRVYDAYMSAFKGLKEYQNFRRKDWWDKGYILLSPLTGHKAFIYDYEELQEIQKSFKEPGFWEYYREMKDSAPTCETVQKVKYFFKRKSTYEKKSINFPIQAAGSMCLRYSMIYFFEYIRKNKLFDIVKICITPYDEINCEAPEKIAYEIAKVLYNCMVKAGEIFCTECKLDADISYIDNNKLPDHWVH